MALVTLYRVIMKGSHQGPASHRGDAYCTELLRRALNGLLWSHEALLHVASHGLSFQKLDGRHNYTKKLSWFYCEMWRDIAFARSPMMYLAWTLPDR